MNAPRLTLVPLREPEDVPALVDWLSSDRWPYHGTPEPQLAEVERRVREGDFSDDETESHWLVHDGRRVGLLILQELRDLTPIFDLRLRTDSRGQGLGADALELIARRVFTELDKTRVEGHTRVDNVGMRRVFVRSGWVKEAHYRQAWPGEDGRLFDAITYGLLRSDWEQGTQTPVPFAEEPASTRPAK